LFSKYNVVLLLADKGTMFQKVNPINPAVKGGGILIELPEIRTDAKITADDLRVKRLTFGI
jgi:hypothetical protein